MTSRQGENREHYSQNIKQFITKIFLVCWFLVCNSENLLVKTLVTSVTPLSVTEIPTSFTFSSTVTLKK